jgi:hypothetical protein
MLMIPGLCWPQFAFAQNIDVEWYPPEIERSATPMRSKVIISGRTVPGSGIHVDGSSVTTLQPKTQAAPPAAAAERQLRANCTLYQQPSVRGKVLKNLPKGLKLQAIEISPSWYKVSAGGTIGFLSQPCLIPLKTSEAVDGALGGDAVIESRDAKASSEGFFEVTIELPSGLSQMPVQVTAPNKEQKTFLISVDVNPVKEDIKTDAKVSTKKPPAAAKRIRLWAGAGLTYQTFTQTATGSPDLNFNTVQAPGLMARGGYWGEQWGIDLYFRDAPGKINASAPYQTQSDGYHWKTIDAKGLYQFRRNANSRLFGLPSQWQLRFGAELQQIPYLGIAGTTISSQDRSLTMGMLGLGLLLGEERDWSYEFAFGYQQLLSAKGDGASLTVDSPLAYELQIGAAYKFAPGWRIGLFSYLQSLGYKFQQGNADGTTTSGQQHLFYTTMDLRLGYEF